MTSRASFVRCLLAVISIVMLLGRAAMAGAPFPVLSHDDVAIEWWYANAHVTTQSKRHLAVIASFFRFGNGKSPFDPSQTLPRSHYVIYAVTDLDKKTQRTYSFADSNMIDMYKKYGPILAVMDPNNKVFLNTIAALKQDKMPEPHARIAGNAIVHNNPFLLSYGRDHMLWATDETNTDFMLHLKSALDETSLAFVPRKGPMAVGGKGETGLAAPSDMHYFSLTHCAVGGKIDTGDGMEEIASGSGWIDHQWGNSWAGQNDGWDWWGVQLDDGTDVLLYRHRELATGKVFYPLATFMDKSGKQSVTKKITFAAEPGSVWKSPQTGVSYPLTWILTFPEKHLMMRVTPIVKAQEMPILGPIGAIWEGSCNVDAAWSPPGAPKRRSSGRAYMELVGYTSEAVRASLGKATGTAARARRSGK